MIIGVGAQNAKDELREFVEAAKIPVIHTLPLKQSFLMITHIASVT